MPFDLHEITGVAENPCKNVQAEQASLTSQEGIHVYQSRAISPFPLKLPPP